MNPTQTQTLVSFRFASPAERALHLVPKWFFIGIELLLRATSKSQGTAKPPQATCRQLFVDPINLLENSKWLVPFLRGILVCFSIRQSVIGMCLYTRMSVYVGVCISTICIYRIYPVYLIIPSNIIRSLSFV